MFGSSSPLDHNDSIKPSVGFTRNNVRQTSITMMRQTSEIFDNDADDDEVGDTEAKNWKLKQEMPPKLLIDLNKNYGDDDANKICRGKDYNIIDD